MPGHDRGVRYAKGGSGQAAVSVHHESGDVPAALAVDIKRAALALLARAARLRAGFVCGMDHHVFAPLGTSFSRLWACAFSSFCTFSGASNGHVEAPTLLSAAFAFRSSQIPESQCSNVLSSPIARRKVSITRRALSPMDGLSRTN
jgi:hypothetical protein